MIESCQKSYFKEFPMLTHENKVLVWANVTEPQRVIISGQMEKAWRKRRHTIAHKLSAQLSDTTRGPAVGNRGHGSSGTQTATSTAASSAEVRPELRQFDRMDDQ